MTTTVRIYEIGGMSVEMTAGQARRWNAGETTDSDLDAVRVAIPTRTNSARYVSLRRATSRIERETAEQMSGMPANLIG